MEDIRILKRAKLYMTAMSEGINPLTGEYVPEGDSISQPRIQKCCEYVAGLIDKMITKQEKSPFAITPQQCLQVRLSQTPIGISDLAKRINAATPKNISGITGTKIADWLVDNGYLSVETTRTTETKTYVRNRKVLNDRSRELGITMTQGTKKSSGEVYDKLLYSEKAQKFILDNINIIANN